MNQSFVKSHFGQSGGYQFPQGTSSSNQHFTNQSQTPCPIYIPQNGKYSTYTMSSNRASEPHSVQSSTYVRLVPAGMVKKMTNGSSSRLAQPHLESRVHLPNSNYTMSIVDQAKNNNIKPELFDSSTSLNSQYKMLIRNSSRTNCRREALAPPPPPPPSVPPPPPPRTLRVSYDNESSSMSSSNDSGLVGSANRGSSSVRRRLENLNSVYETKSSNNEEGGRSVAPRTSRRDHEEFVSSGKTSLTEQFKHNTGSTGRQSIKVIRSTDINYEDQANTKSSFRIFTSDNEKKYRGESSKDLEIPVSNRHIIQSAEVANSTGPFRIKTYLNKNAEQVVASPPTISKQHTFVPGVDAANSYIKSNNNSNTSMSKYTKFFGYGNRGAGIEASNESLNNRPSSIVINTKNCLETSSYRLRGSIPKNSSAIYYDSGIGADSSGNNMVPSSPGKSHNLYNQSSTNHPVGEYGQSYMTNPMWVGSLDRRNMRPSRLVTESRHSLMKPIDTKLMLHQPSIKTLQALADSKEFTDELKSCTVEPKGGVDTMGRMASSSRLMKNNLAQSNLPSTNLTSIYSSTESLSSSSSSSSSSLASKMSRNSLTHNSTMFTAARNGGRRVHTLLTTKRMEKLNQNKLTAALNGRSVACSNLSKTESKASIKSLITPDVIKKNDSMQLSADFTAPFLPQKQNGQRVSDSVESEYAENKSSTKQHKTESSKWNKSSNKLGGVGASMCSISNTFPIRGMQSFVYANKAAELQSTAPSSYIKEPVKTLVEELEDLTFDSNNKSEETFLVGSKSTKTYNPNNTTLIYNENSSKNNLNLLNTYYSGANSNKDAVKSTIGKSCTIGSNSSFYVPTSDENSELNNKIAMTRKQHSSLGHKDSFRSTSERSSIQSTKYTVCTAWKDFVAVYSKNINLKKDEKYVLLDKSNQSWYLVKDKYGHTGYAPSSYLRLESDSGIETNCSSMDKSHYSKSWFHGNLSRSEAYILLVAGQNLNGTFLVRNNSLEKGKYTLSIFKSGKVYNYRINNMDHQYFIDPKNKFTTLTELIEFYQKNPAGLVYVLKYSAEKNFVDINSIFDSLNSVFSKFLIKRDDLDFIEKIGSGQFGVVLKAEYKKRKLVAVKKMKPGSKEDEMNFNREAEFMMKLQSLQDQPHRNLVQLYGLCKDSDDSVLIVTEFVKYGSLYNYLLKSKEKIANSKNRFMRLITMCIDICDGMEYLENKHIIHRDLATRNCLVGENEIIKVADFGLARFTDDCYIAHPQSQFPVKWSAPEVIKHRSYSNKSDVWSFACLMYEMFTLGKMPYGGSTANSVAAKQIVNGIIPEKPTYSSTSLYEFVMIKAWNKDPKDRPTFQELHKLLRAFV